MFTQHHQLTSPSIDSRMQDRRAHRGTRRHGRRGRAVLCEALETRRMFITYQVDGTSGNDTISISINGNDIISVVNGVSDSASDIINNNIEINALGGNDTVSIVETGANTVVVNAGTGNDTINAGNGGNDLDVIDDTVTVNGDGNTDTLVLFDQNNANTNNFTLDNGNIYTRNAVANIVGNVENVTIHGSTTHAHNFLVNDPPTADVLYNATNAQFNQLSLDGLGTRSGTFRPSSSTSLSGSIDFGASTISFTRVDQLQFDDFSTATLITPNPNDSVNIASGAVVTGNSGAIVIPAMVASSTDVLFVDLGTNDAGAGNDAVTGTSGHAGATTLMLDVGTGTNSLTANGGVWNVSTLNGANLDATAAGGTTSLNFAGTQTIKRLEINSGASAGVTGGSAALTVQNLAVVTGAGSLGVSSPASIGVTQTFSIGAGRVLNKTGSGTLNVSATQTHGAGSFFNSSGGITNFSTDAGSPSARPLSVDATNATVSFNTTQHLNFISTGIGGLLRVGVNGNRVLVCNDLFIDTEGSAIDLTNNDMIVDYTTAGAGAAVLQLVRNGRAGGSWAGIGIVSATAAASPQQNTTLGVLEATEYKGIYGPGATFAGQAIDNTAVLIKFTYYGDTDFSGTVDFDDYVRIDSGFNGDLGGWLNGDFDLSGGNVDFDDYVLIDNSFNTQGAPL